MAQRTVRFYRDTTKAEHIGDLPVNDLGINTGSEFEPNSADGIAHIAKMMLVGQGKATREECEGFHYEVVER